MRDTDLDGWTVVVTRAEPEDGTLGELFRAAGARVLRIPTVEVALPEDPGPLEAACRKLAGYAWVVFTSARAVEAVARVVPSGATLPAVAVVGSGTGDAVRDHGWPVTLEGEGEGGRALAARLLEVGLSEETPVLFPASSRARPDLVELLTAADVPVDRVTAYETRTLAPDLANDPGLPDADAVTFTSPSAVEGWSRGAGEDFRGPLSPGAHLVAIGGTTGDRLEGFGVDPVIADEPSFEGLVECVRTLRKRESR